MKKLMIVAFLVLMAAGTASANTEHSPDAKNMYSVTAALQNNTPKVGNNTITVEVKNAAGYTVNDSRVCIEYGMVGKQDSKRAVIDGGLLTDCMNNTGGKYTGVLNLSAPGEWVIDVKTRRSGKLFSKSYNVTVVQ